MAQERKKKKKKGKGEPKIAVRWPRKGRGSNREEKSMGPKWGGENQGRKKPTPPGRCRMERIESSMKLLEKRGKKKKRGGSPLFAGPEKATLRNRPSKSGRRGRIHNRSRGGEKKNRRERPPRGLQSGGEEIAERRLPT